MKREPAVSVILPTCDRPDMLRVALKSLAWQSFRDFEVVVVNDGRIDIATTVAEFAPVLDIRAVSHATPRRGISAARNTGIRLARGNWLVYLDDDDFFYKEHLEILHEAIASGPFKVVYTDAILALQEKINGVYQTVARDLPISLDFDPAVLAWRNITPTHTLIHEKSCLRRSLPFAPYLRGHEDWDLWQRLGRHYRFNHLALPTAEYLRRQEAQSLSAVKDDMAEGWLFVRRQGLLHSAMPPAYSLAEAVDKAVFAGPPSGPCRVSVILPLGQASAFLAEKSATRALDALCSRLGEAQLILAGAGEGMGEICQRAAIRQGRPPRCASFSTDVGRVFSANRAAALAEGEWLVFLEPGVEPCPGWLDSLLAAADQCPRAGALGGLVESPRIGLIAGGRFNAKGDLIFNRLPRDTASDAPLATDCLPGLCLMLRREHFLALEGFSPAFAPGHHADADVCLRLRQRGLDSVVAPKARLLWNRDYSPLRQSPAGLVSRRAFRDSWSDAPFPLASLVSGSEWSMRPEALAGLWPSEGQMPPTFDIALPPRLR